MKRFIIAVSAALAATSAHGASVDLSTWTQNGSGNWVLQPGNDSVLQTTNGSPTVFYSDYSAFGNKLSGKITVKTTSDDDFIGFVVGYNPGDISNPSANYLLVDWKQGTQGSFGCTAFAGLAVSQVSGVLGNDSGAWCHAPANNVTELARGSSLASTGWADNTTYSFDIEYTSSSFKLLVDGVEQVALNGSFGDGRFGFYNYSQSSVLYEGVTNDPLPAVPEPASWAMMIGGLGLVGGALRRARTGRRLLALA